MAKYIRNTFAMRFFYSGIVPFLFTFTLNLLAQCIVVVFVLELLQIAHQILSSEAKVQDSDDILADENPLDPEFGGTTSENNNNHRSNEDPLDIPEDDQYIIDEETGETVRKSDLFKSDLPELKNTSHPTFYCLGKIFLQHQPILRVLFVVAMILNFMSLLVSYCLAGTQAYSGILPGNGLAAFHIPTAFANFGENFSSPVQGVGYKLRFKKMHLKKFTFVHF